MKKGISVRAYRQGDEAGIFLLQQAVYPDRKYDREKWLRRWRWMYQQNPAGKPVIYLAEDDGKIVGQYAIVPVRMKIGEVNTLSAISLDTMTHPDYRGQGIFTALSTWVFDDAGKRGIDTIYGMPNKMTSWHQKYWLEVGPKSLLIKPLKTKNILSKSIHNKFLVNILTPVLNLIMKLFFATAKAEANGLTITKVPSFDERVEDLWKRVSNDYEIIVIRDKKYLNWRYVDLPDVDYKIFLAEREGQVQGYAVLKCENQQGLTFGRIHDLVVPAGQEKIARALIQKAVDFFEGEKADLVIYRMIASRQRYKTLRKSGLAPPRFISNKLRLVTRPNTTRFTGTFLRDSSHWFVQTGDFDPV
jgi:GNAT superfamily N-acetyltransferase